MFASDFLVGAYVSFYFAESYIRHVKLSGNLLLGQAERFSHRRKFLALGVLQPHGVPQRRVNLLAMNLFRQRMASRFVMPSDLRFAM